jgi:hypothetical protein
LSAGKPRVFVHYHEYVSPEEYMNGMKLVRYFHLLERNLYPLCEWVSHTNEKRLSLFEYDENLAPGRRHHVLPNYPPKGWKNLPHKHIEYPLRVVYVGALSNETMYVREFADWVKAQNGLVIWHIYSSNADQATIDLIQSYEDSIIQLKEAVNYYQLPEVLLKYQLGVILYRGHIPNYVYNAPNKLFEYLTCGLDVCFPSVMSGCYPYVERSSAPLVFPVDFDQLENFKLDAVFEGRTVNSSRDVRFYAENIYQKLVDALLKNSDS